MHAFATLCCSTSKMHMILELRFSIDNIMSLADTRVGSIQGAMMGQ